MIYTVERIISSENFERKQNLNFDRSSVKLSAFEIWIIVELLSNNFFPVFDNLSSIRLKLIRILGAIRFVLIMDYFALSFLQFIWLYAVLVKAVNMNIINA